MKRFAEVIREDKKKNQELPAVNQSKKHKKKKKGSRGNPEEQSDQHETTQMEIDDLDKFISAVVSSD